MKLLQSANLGTCGRNFDLKADAKISALARPARYCSTPPGDTRFNEPFVFMAETDVTKSIKVFPSKTNAFKSIPPKLGNLNALFLVLLESKIGCPTAS